MMFKSPMRFTLCLTVFLFSFWFISQNSYAQVSSKDIVLYAADAKTKVGNWAVVPDQTAAGGARLANPSENAKKIKKPLAAPADYFELTFNAEGGKPYRLWIRAKSEGDLFLNDSAYVQFSNTVNDDGDPVDRIGTNSADTIVLQQCLGCPISDWGWQDNGWGYNVLGPQIYFASTGAQTIRIQTREDGLSIDQIVLSPDTYLDDSPGKAQNDTVILPRSDGGSSTNKSPTVSITASATSGFAPLSVNFTANANDPDGRIVEHNWNFGDGESSTSAQVTNVYDRPGNYRVRLTVTDDDGATATATLQIAVEAQVLGGTEKQLKVMSFNMAMGKGTDNVVDLDRTASYIAAYDPDVVALSEIQKYSGSANQTIKLPQLMQQKTGRTWYLHFAPKYPGITEGMAVMSRYPFASTDEKFLTYGMSVVQAAIVVGGRRVNVFSTHLDWNSSYKRLVQANELVNWVKRFSEPRIVAGDFNAWPDQTSIAAMILGYRDAWAEAFSDGTARSYADNPPGWNTRTRRGRIDYIFYSKGSSGALQLKSAQTPDIRDLSKKKVKVRLGTTDDKGVRPSDHNMVIATFEIK